MAIWTVLPYLFSICFRVRRSGSRSVHLFELSVPRTNVFLWSHLHLMYSRLNEISNLCDIHFNRLSVICSVFIRAYDGGR